MDIEDQLFVDDDGDILNVIRFGFPRRYYQRTDFFHDMDDLSFFRRFRLQKNTVLLVLEQLEDQLEFDNNLNNSVSPINQLLTTLRFYSCNAHQNCIGDFINMHQTTASRIISKVEQFTVLWLLLIVIVAGNLGVIYTLIVGRSRKSRMNYFITHLAFADLCVGMISVLTDLVWRSTVSWNAGNVACKLIKFLQVVVTYASTYVLVALSIDRYDAIRHPMKFSGSWRRAKCLIIAAWLFSVLFSIPILILYEEKYVQDQVQCWIEFSDQWKWQLYVSLVSISIFGIPAIIISACYAIIIITIWTKSATTFQVYKKRPNDGRKGSDNSKRASSRGLIPRAKVKTIKTTFTIVSVFIICWSPYMLFDLLQVYGQIPQTQTNIAIATFVQSLAPLNSAANPIIYCIFSTHFCRTLWLLPPCKWICKKKKRKPRDSTLTTQSSSLSEFLTNTHKKRLEGSNNIAQTVLIHAKK